jgi:hypothetical protein
MPADDAARPTAEELVTAVREFLQTTLLPDVPAEHAFHLRVAVNVLGMVERELADGGTAASGHARRLADLGYRDDAELAAAIRSGAVSATQLPEVITAVRADVLARLKFADPAYAAQYKS